jgi:hypothetical protein
MPVVVTCPTCQKKARVPRASVGKSVKCPSCGASFTADPGEPVAPPSHFPADLDDESNVPPLPDTPEADARRVTRHGVGLLALAQALLAAGTVLQLLLALIRLITSDAGGRSAFQESFTEFAMIAGTLALVGGVIAGLIGAVFCTVAPAAVSLRAVAGSVLALSFLTVSQASPMTFRDLSTEMARPGRLPNFPTDAFAGLMMLAALSPEMFQAARQALLAVYARSQARRLGDRTAAGLGALLAIAYPAVVVGLLVLAAVVGMFGSKPHATFDQVLTVLVLLAKTVLIALGAFVLLRVWLALGAERG